MENSIDSKINSTRDGVTQIGKDLRADAHAAIDKVADKVPPATDLAAASAHAGVDKVADTVESTSDRLATTSASLAARGKQVAEGYTKLAESGRSHVRASPAISVLIAAAAGYGLSKLLNSRNSK
jgi:ElaB protein